MNRPRQLDSAIEYLSTVVHSHGPASTRLVASTTASMLAAVYREAHGRNPSDTLRG